MQYAVQLNSSGFCCKQLFFGKTFAFEKCSLTTSFVGIQSVFNFILETISRCRNSNKYQTIECSTSDLYKISIPRCPTLILDSIVKDFESAIRVVLFGTEKDAWLE